MSGPGESTVEVVRKATRGLARKFGYGYWREKDKLGEYPWEAARVRLKARSSWWPSAAAARRRVGVEHGDGADLDSSAVP
jgi:hypothetical protein